MPCIRPCFIIFPFFRQFFPSLCSVPVSLVICYVFLSFSRSSYFPRRALYLRQSSSLIHTSLSCSSLLLFPVPMSSCYFLLLILVHFSSSFFVFRFLLLLTFPLLFLSLFSLCLTITTIFQMRKFPASRFHEGSISFFFLRSFSINLYICSFSLSPLSLLYSSSALNSPPKHR